MTGEEKIKRKKGMKRKRVKLMLGLILFGRLMFRNNGDIRSKLYNNAFKLSAILIRLVLCC